MQSTTCMAHAPSASPRGKVVRFESAQPTGRVQAHVLPERRSVALQLILVDASRGAREYVQRWVAGRGAE